MIVTSVHTASAGHSLIARDGVTKFSDLLQDSAGKIGELISLHPHLTARKTCALCTHLCKVLAKVPSFESATHEYQGMVDTADICALTGDPAWINFSDPVFDCQANRVLNPIAQHDAEITNAAIMVYISQQNVKWVVNDAVNRAVPKAYFCNPNIVRVREFQPTDNPRQIITSLTTRYSQKNDSRGEQAVQETN